MNSTQLARAIVQAILNLSLIAIGVYALYLLQSLLLYIIIGAIISLIGRPLTVVLKKKLKFSNGLSAISTMTFFVILLFGLFSLFIPLVVQQSENLSLLDVNALELKVNQLLIEMGQYFNLQETNWQSWLFQNDLMDSLNLKAIPEFLNNLLGWLSGFTIGLFSVLFISFFLLKDAQLLERSVLLFLPSKNHKRIQQSFEKIKNLLSRYFIGLLLQITILFVIYSIVLFILGVKNAMIIAFLCALLNLIPYLGPLIGGILMLLLTMTANLDADFSTVILPKSMYVFIGFIVGQLVDNFFSQPFIFSNSVRSHPLEIFIIIMTAGILFGTIGLIVAIPLYTALKVIVKAFYSDNKIVQSITKDL